MTDRLQEGDLVALLLDIPEHKLRRGDIGTVIQIVVPTSRSDSVQQESVDPKAEVAPL